MGNSASELAVGLVLGETYEIVRLLGEGGMGAVWEASHLRLPGKRCAVKVLHGQATADREAYARFRREAEIASRIGHPNIVEVLDWNTLPSGTPYLVLEYLEGEDLAARLANGPVPVDQALYIARQIGAALKAAHAADVVHRDLKPANVFLVPREIGGEMVDHVKVLDFGISKIRNSQTVQTQDAVLLGTPQYMAPEQALGKNNEIDGRTDVFALAAIVYEMLSGRPCFQGNSLAEVVFKVVYEPVAPLTTVVPGVDPSIAAAVERAMSKTPADRFPDVSAFIAALTGRSLATSARGALSGIGSSPTERGAVPPTAGRGVQGADPTQPGDPALSHLRGEIHARTEQSPPPPPSGGRRTALFLMIALAIGGSGIFVALRILRTDKPVVAASDQIAVNDAVVPKMEPVAEKAPVAAKIDPVGEKGPTPGTPGEHKAEPGPKQTAVDPVPEQKRERDPVASKKRTEPAGTPEPPAVKAMLDEAEAAMRSRKRGDGMLLAERSLRTQKTSRAYSIMTRAHCASGDIGNAKATYQHVSPGERPRVRKECKSHDIDLN